MLTNMNLYIQITRYSTLKNFTVTRETDHLSIINTWWYRNRNFFLLYKFRINYDLSIYAEDRFLERKFNIYRDITSASDTATTKYTREDVTEISSIKSSITETGEIKTKSRRVKSSTSKAPSPSSTTTYS